MQNTNKLFKKTAFLCSKYIYRKLEASDKCFVQKTSDRSDYVRLPRGHNYAPTLRNLANRIKWRMLVLVDSAKNTASVR